MFCRLFKSNGRGRKFGEKCKAGDRVGCGVKFEQVFEDGTPRQMVPVFFTRNGKEVSLNVPLYSAKHLSKRATVFNGTEVSTPVLTCHCIQRQRGQYTCLNVPLYSTAKRSVHLS